MIPIADVPSSSRFLMLAARLSESRWNDEREAVCNWLATIPSTTSDSKAQQIRETVGKPLSPDEIAVVVIHCYADIPPGTAYQVVFDPTDPDTNETTHAETVFGVVLGKYVEATLAHGWHQTVILRFPNGPPRLLKQLPIDTITTSYFGLCAGKDFPKIYQALKNTARSDTLPPQQAAYFNDI